MAEFVLEAGEIRSVSEWQLRLSRGSEFLAHHQVRLPTDTWEAAAFTDLASYLSQHADPKNRRASEEQLVRQVGDWAGRQVFGDIAPVLLQQIQEAKEPVTLRLRLNPSHDGGELAQQLARYPFELAHLAGRPLATHPVCVIYESFQRSEPKSRPRRPRTRAVRMLAVFAQPGAGDITSLRQERHALQQLVTELAAGRRWDFELRVLQFGVTRQVLAEALAEDEGWDIVHLAGAALGDHLLLDNGAGGGDPLPANAWAEALQATRGRIQWLTLSASQSPAESLQELSQFLGLNAAHPSSDPVALPDPAGSAARAASDRLTALGHRLAEDLDCAVLVSRFPLAEEFAVRFNTEMYQGVLEQHLPLERAVQRATQKLIVRSADAHLYPALSVISPVLIGDRAAGLTIQPAMLERNGGGPTMPDISMYGVPAQNRHLIGRVRELAAANQFLSAGSDKTAVLFAGPQGVGKSTCAAELAWQYDQSRRFEHIIWFKAPDTGRDTFSTLQDFALSWEAKIPDLPWIHLVDQPSKLRDVLPKISEMLAQHRILVVLDGMETMVDHLPGGPAWRQPLWGDLVDTMLLHQGASRLVLTSASPLPLGVSDYARSHHLDASRQTEVIPMAPLRLDESLLMTRGLKHLAKLIVGEFGLDPAVRDQQRELLLQVLRWSQGHPLLLSLANGLAAEPAELAAVLTKATAAGQGEATLLDHFLAAGTSLLPAEAIPDTLRRGTEAVCSTLGSDVMLMFQFLSCLEESDLVEPLVVPVWPNFCKRMGQAVAEPPETPADDDDSPMPPDHEEQLFEALLRAAEESGQDVDADALRAALEDEDSPFAQMFKMMSEIHGAAAEAARMAQIAHAGFDPVIDQLLETGLVARHRDAKNPTLIHYSIHPCIADTGRKLAGDEVQGSVDEELIQYWGSAFVHGQKNERNGGEMLLRLASFRAAPYLFRLQKWEISGAMLEQTMSRDQTPTTVAVALPLLRQIVLAKRGTEAGIAAVGVLAKALILSSREAEAEALIRETAVEAEVQHHFEVAAGMYSLLAVVLLNSGRVNEAMAAVESRKNATRAAGLGPWSQLADEAQRLHMLMMLGRFDEVLREVDRLEAEMVLLPSESDQPETVDAPKVREGILDIGHTATLHLSKWDRALDLNRLIVDSMREREASDVEIARVRFNDYGPLLRLERYEEARELLRDCLAAAERGRDVELLGSVFGATALLEDAEGHFDRAVEAGFQALRIAYATGNVSECSIGHFNLANFMMRMSQAPEVLLSALAHRLAAVVLMYQLDSGHLRMALGALANHLAMLRAEPRARMFVARDGSGWEALCQIVEMVPGIQFRTLFERLPKTRAATGPQALAKVLGMIAQSPGPRPQQPGRGSAGDAGTPYAEVLGALKAMQRAGVDLSDVFAMIRAQFVADHPDDPEEIARFDAFLADLRDQLEKEGPGDDEPMDFEEDEDDDDPPMNYK